MIFGDKEVLRVYIAESLQELREEVAQRTQAVKNSVQAASSAVPYANSDRLPKLFIQ